MSPLLPLPFQVLLWSIQDHMETLLAGSSRGGGDKASASSTSSSPELGARTILRGHSDTIEDVVFKPGSSEQLASVGDDHALLFWDTRRWGWSRRRRGLVDLDLDIWVWIWILTFGYGSGS